MKQTVLLPQDIAKPGRDYLLERGYELKMGRGISEKLIAEDVRGCSAVIARLGAFGKHVISPGTGPDMTTSILRQRRRQESG